VNRGPNDFNESMEKRYEIGGRFSIFTAEVFMASQLLRIWWRWGVANMEGKMGFQTGNNGSSKEKDSPGYMDD